VSDTVVSLLIQIHGRRAGQPPELLRGGEALRAAGQQVAHDRALLGQRRLAAKEALEERRLRVLVGSHSGTIGARAGTAAANA